MQEFITHSLDILPDLARGMVWTLTLTFVSGILGTLMGLVTAVARISKSKVLKLIASGYVTLFRGTPLLLQILFFYGALPQLGILLDPFPTVVIALSLNAGAYIAEIIRAAIQSIDKGQMEAARTLGMSYNQAMRRVILPQTFRRLVPPMVNEFAALTKETSLAMVVSILELMKVSQHIAAKSFLVLQTYFWTGMGYLVVVVALTNLATHLEKKLEARE